MNLPSNLRTEADRRAVEREANKLLAANDNSPLKGREPVYRGGRPSFNWCAKQDQFGAAALWLVARQRLPLEAANDNEPQPGGLDVRRNGAARGKSKFKIALGEHLSIPGVLPRLGDPEPQPVEPRGFTRQDIIMQNDIEELSDNFRSFGACADAVAAGAIFIGAASGLGTPRPGKSKGSPLKAEEPDFGEPPADVEYVLELVAARENVAGIGKAFGAQGRYADRKGAEMLRKAMDWAKAQVAESNFHANVTNRVA